MPADNPTISARPDYPITGHLVMAALFPDEEVWAPVPDFPGYLASSHGRGASTRKRTGQGRGRGTKWVVTDRIQTILTPAVRNDTGRPFLSLSRDGRLYGQQVGHWVLRAFVGHYPYPPFECCHRDGDPTNNRLENLHWGTQSENAFDAVIHRVQRSVKLTPDQVREIRRRLEAGERVVALSREYGVDSSSVSRIRSQERWAQLPG